MSESNVPRLTAQDLIRIGRARPAGRACATCAQLACPGWESMPAGFDRAGLRRIGTLRDASIEDATYLEHHPLGTNAWSARAPIALHFFPYNRAEVWECVACTQPFLRYTEHGGYYEDERIRELDAGLVDDALVAG